MWFDVLADTESVCTGVWSFVCVEDRGPFGRGGVGLVGVVSSRVGCGVLGMFCLSTTSSYYWT